MLICMMCSMTERSRLPPHFNDNIGYPTTTELRLLRLKQFECGKPNTVYSFHTMCRSWIEITRILVLHIVRLRVIEKVLRNLKGWKNLLYEFGGKTAPCATLVL